MHKINTSAEPDPRTRAKVGTMAMVVLHLACKPLEIKVVVGPHYQKRQSGQFS